MNHLTLALITALTFTGSLQAAQALESKARHNNLVNNSAAKTKFESLTFEDVKLGSAFNTIQAESKKQGVSIQFVLNDPDGKIANLSINLKLRDVYLEQAIKYMSIVSGFSYEIKDNTINIGPK